MMAVERAGARWRARAASRQPLPGARHSQVGTGRREPVVLARPISRGQVQRARTPSLARGPGLNRVSQGSALAAAIRYGLRHWAGLCRFLDDGRLEMDTNVVEREIRPVAVTARRRCSPAARAAARSGPPPRRWSAPRC